MPTTAATIAELEATHAWRWATPKTEKIALAKRRYIAIQDYLLDPDSEAEGQASMTFNKKHLRDELKTLAAVIDALDDTVPKRSTIVGVFPTGGLR